MQRIRVMTASRRIGIELRIDDAMAHSVRNLSIRRTKSVARAAVAAGTRVVAGGLKQLVKGVRTAQTTGATGRSLTVKSGINRRGNYYGVVAPDLRYIEFHVPNTTLLKVWAKKRGHRVGYTRTGGRKRNRFQYVKSFYRRRNRRANSLKRRPGKYWHLINDGFNHRWAGPVPGYEFVARAAYLTENEAIATVSRIWIDNAERIIFGPDPGFRN